MSKIYDTGDITLDDGGAVVAQYYWSDLEEITVNNYGAKILKIIIECLTAGSVTGSLCIFSETNGDWANDEDFAAEEPLQAPFNTTGHMATIEFTTIGTINDTVRYFMNNDSTVVNIF